MNDELSNIKFDCRSKMYIKRRQDCLKGYTYLELSKLWGINVSKVIQYRKKHKLRKQDLMSA